MDYIEQLPDITARTNARSSETHFFLSEVLRKKLSSVRNTKTTTIPET